MYFRYFVIISPWKRVGHFIWTNLNPLYPKIALCQVWLKLTHWFWTRFFNFVNEFCYFVITPLGIGQGPSFEQTWIPLTQEWCVPSLVKIGPVVLEKKMKMWKVYRQTDGQQAIKAHLSFQLRWAKKLLIFWYQKIFWIFWYHNFHIRISSLFCNIDVGVPYFLNKV